MFATVFISTAATMSPLIPLSENKIFCDNYVFYLKYNNIIHNNKKFCLKIFLRFILRLNFFNNIKVKLI